MLMPLYVTMRLPHDGDRSHYDGGYGEPTNAERDTTDRTTDLPRLRPHEEEEEEEEEEEASTASVPDSRSDEASEKDT